MTLQGRTAVVTGGTRGIGRAIAARLLHEGVSVAICGRSSTAVAKAVADLGLSGNGKVCGMRVDVSRPDDVHRLFAFADVELAVSISWSTMRGWPFFAAWPRWSPANGGKVSIRT